MACSLEYASLRRTHMCGRGRTFNLTQIKPGNYAAV